jgi:Ca2+-binding RTX toxin-like protein
MALQVIASDKIGLGIQVDLGTTADAFVSSGVTVGSMDDIAIYGTDNNHSVNVQGTVIGESAGVVLGSDLDSSGQHLVVGVNGHVETSSPSYAGAFIRGFSSQVDNAGTIHGETYGLSLVGAGANHTTVINNSGLIEGGDTAVYRPNVIGADQTVELHNTGEIRSGYSAYNANITADARDIVVNAGLMLGHVVLGSGNDIYDGTGGQIVGNVWGGAGADQLSGGDFADSLLGGDGSDSLFGGGGDDKLFADAANDTVSGGSGSDYVDGGVGADNMDGGAGNDTFVVDESGDFVFDTGGGVDTVLSYVDFDLLDFNQVQGALENVVLVGAGNLEGDGNALANILTGNSGKNSLFGNGGHDNLLGNGGDDHLEGNAGNDVLDGGNGADRLFGGVGRDVLTGGAGADKFVFDTRLGSTDRDTVTDFQHGVDKVWLDNAVFRALGLEGSLKDGFFYAGAAAHDANDHLIYNRATAALSYDVDGMGGQSAVQFATLKGTPLLTAHDFLVI